MSHLEMTTRSRKSRLNSMSSEQSDKLSEIEVDAAGDNESLRVKSLTPPLTSTQRRVNVKKTSQSSTVIRSSKKSNKSMLEIEEDEREMICGTQDGSIFDTNAGSFNQSGDLDSSQVNIQKKVNARFGHVQLQRVAHQTVCNSYEVFSPVKVDAWKEEIVMLSCDGRGKSRLSFFDIYDLEPIDNSEFDFHITDFALGNEMLIFVSVDSQLYSWELRARSLGYDAIDSPGMSNILSLTAFEDVCGICYDKPFSYFPCLSILSTKQANDQKRLEKSFDASLEFRTDPKSVTLIKNDEFLAFCPTQKFLAVLLASGSHKIVQLMKLSLHSLDVRTIVFSAGRDRRFPFAVMSCGFEGKRKLCLFDLNQKTMLPPLLGDDSLYDNISNPIGCCFSQSKLGMLHFEDFQDRQRISLFDFEIRVESSTWNFVKKFMIFVTLIIAISIVLWYYFSEHLDVFYRLFPN